MTDKVADYTEFEEIKQRREEIGGLIRRQHEVLQVLGSLDGQRRGTSSSPDLVGELLLLLSDMEERVCSDSFRVLVVGEFNRGKSTFINALLGRQVLPSYATPTTAVINELKYGQDPRVILYPRAPKEGPPPQPVPIDVGELERHVVVDPENDRKPNPYEKVDIYWPLDLCRSGVELIDSPGLNEDPDREEITIRYLGRADAVVFVLDAQQALTANEQSFYRLTVQPLGHEDAFWVFNKINFVDEDQRGAVETRARRMLAELVRFEQRVFFIDAKGALSAQIQRDEDALARSNLGPVRRSLEHFLTSQRGRNKVLVPARELYGALRRTQDFVRERQDLLNGDLDELLARYERNQVPLEGLEVQARFLSRELTRELNELTDHLQQSAESYMLTLAGRVPELMTKITPRAKMTLNPFRIKDATGELINDLLEQVAFQVREELATWYSEEYLKTLSAGLETIENEVTSQVRDFQEKLVAVQLDLSSIAPSDGKGHELELGGNSDGSAAIRNVGLDRGMWGMAKVVLPGAAVTVAALLAGIAPVLLIPVFLLWTGGGIDYQEARMTEWVKRKVREQVADELRKKAAGFAVQVRTETEQQLLTLRDKSISSLETEVATVRQQVNAALADKRRGETRVATVRAGLDDLERRMALIAEELERVMGRTLALSGEARPSDAT